MLLGEPFSKEAIFSELLLANLVNHSLFTMCDAGTKEVIPRVSHKHKSGSTGGTNCKPKTFNPN